MDEEHKQYVCPKCGCERFESETFQATGSSSGKINDARNMNFIMIICTECGFTELYRKRRTDAFDIRDYLIGKK